MKANKKEYSVLPQSDEGLNLSIMLAREKSQPIYMVRTNIGTTLHVCVSQREAAEFAKKQPSTVGARVYEQKGGGLYPVA